MNMPEPEKGATPPPLLRRMTFAQERQEAADFWAAKSIPERLQALHELNRDMYKMRGIDIDAESSAATLTRVRRPAR